MHTPRYYSIVFLLALAAVAAAASLSQPGPVTASSAQSFTIEQIKSYPFPNELTASATGAQIAWAFNDAAPRNVWVAEGPDFKARRLTNYAMDDGQELIESFDFEDGKYVVYVRGGDHGSNWESSVGVNPLISATQTKVQIWTIPFAGGEPKLLAEGDEPVISPQGDRVVFSKERGMWSAPVDGSAAAKRLFYARGEPVRPNGRRTVRVSLSSPDRGDHSFVGIYTNDATPIRLSRADDFARLEPALVA